ncbi:hypothetical protein [Mucilaginibacter boryungensis]|uniref:YhhN-like protein n=1 Tax=Mucilaginibacter boryungensis TaxID=768480 RepID=A0ABR9XG96_9SPHI|nr:hypothetical protein [Mucilaginibacter boryungensis]MBE9666085.1 hypothetical protein [Mucilaginibacter boryungensis]
MSLSNLYQSIIVPASTLLPIIAGLIWYKKLSKPLHTLVAYLIIALLINIGGIIMAQLHKNNLPLLHFYTMFELLAVMLYYRHAFNTKLANKWTTVIMILYPVYCIINFTFFQSIYQFNTYTRPLEAIIIIVFSGIYLNSQNTFENKKMINNAGRWVASGFLLYFCGSLFQFIFSNLISHHASKPIKMLIWNLHDTFVLIMYICFFLAIKNERGNR